MDSTTTHWDDWPPPARHSLLQALLKNGCSLAKLATVSREWQKVIEQHNFARIKVTLPRLADIGLTRRCRSYINYIWLCIELKDYSSLQAYSGNSYFLSQKDLGRVTKAIQTLFTELGKWEPSGKLLLDISIHSPSDSDHLLKYLAFPPDIPSNECLGLRNVDHLVDDAGYCWNDWSAAGKADKLIRKTLSSIYPDDSPPSADALEREFEWWGHLPQVPAITSLLLRQQTRRRWLLSTLEEMLSHFPRLQEVVYEPWKLPDHGSQVDADLGKILLPAIYFLP